jgi:hypothetical protein
MPARGVPLVVSIQRSAVANAVEGHLASGVLIDRDRVVVPGPLGWLDDPALPIEVLVASALQDDTGVVERIGIDQVDVIGVQDRPDDAIAVLDLLHSAQHRPAYSAAFEAQPLTNLVAGGRAMWPALRELRIVPDVLEDRPLWEVLQAVMVWERTLRLDLVRSREFVTPDMIGARLCCFLGGCEDCDPDGPWWRC